MRDVDRVCRVRGRFTLRSGIEADEYFDKFLFDADPRLLRRVVDGIVPLVPANTDVLGGIELGGVPIAAVAGQATGLPTAYIRKQARTYGTCKLAEGPDLSGQRVTLIEDAITTGGAARDAALALRELGTRLDTVVCAIDRGASVDVLDRIGLRSVPRSLVSCSIRLRSADRSVRRATASATTCRPKVTSRCVSPTCCPVMDPLPKTTYRRDHWCPQRNPLARRS